MKDLLSYVGAALLGGMLVFLLGDRNEPVWQLAYEHSADGEALEGSKAALIAAVRAGKPVRVYWRGRRVEHVADSYFLTILQDEVFAQIAPISGQKPSVDPAAIELRENKWNTVFATNGERALKWFVWG